MSKGGEKESRYLGVGKEGERESGLVGGRGVRWGTSLRRLTGGVRAARDARWLDEVEGFENTVREKCFSQSHESFFDFDRIQCHAGPSFYFETV